VSGHGVQPQIPMSTGGSLAPAAKSRLRLSVSQILRIPSLQYLRELLYGTCGWTSERREPVSELAGRVNGSEKLSVHPYWMFIIKNEKF